MKINSRKLCYAIDLVSEVISSRCANAMAANLLIKAKGNQVTVTGTNLDEWASEVVAAEDEGEFSCCVNPARLKAAVAFSPEFCSLELNDNVLRVDAGAICRIPALPAEEYVPMPQEEFKEVKLLAGELALGMRSVGFAALKSDSRPILKSVNVRPFQEFCLCEATDGGNGSYYMFKNDSGCKFLLSIEHLKRLTAAMQRNGAKLSLNERSVLVQHDFGSYSVKQLEGQYPNTDMVRTDKSYMPNKKLGEVNAGDLGNTLKLACAMSSVQDGGMVSVQMKFSNKGIEIDGENFSRMIPGKFPEFSVNMNARCLAECCDAFSGNVQLATGDLKFLHLNSGNLSVFSMPLRDK